jgi:hypothetical protein
LSLTVLSSDLQLWTLSPLVSRRHSWRARRALFLLQPEPGTHIRGIDLTKARDGKVAKKLSYVKG